MHLHQPTSPPFVMLTLVTMAMLLWVQAARGVDHVLAPTDPWPESTAVAPGDRLFLTPGFYKELPVISYQGTEALPITISSVDSSQPATIVGDTWGMTIRGGHHIKVRTLMVLAGESGGIRLERDAAGPSRSIILENVYVVPKPGSLTNVGIDLEGVEGSRLINLKVDLWSRAAVQIRDARNVEIRGLTIRGDKNASIGVRVNDAVDGLRILDSSMLTIGGSGVAIGMTTSPPPASEPETAPAPAARNVRIERCVLERVAIPFTFASVADVLCDHCTIVEPESAAFELRSVRDGWPSASGIRIENNLIWWTVNVLKRFVIDDQPEGEFQMGPNLWWAAEMPAAIEWLGGFPSNAEPQVVDVDPRLIPRTTRATNPAAREFGHRGVTDDPSPAP
ncbi:MAG: right-handed parallel beta-helix repeat-containing protein [Phycisphaerales bacterium]|nr:right-handed parallel beta-helix repeat-containing protein [Phycisphaerales bacterium]